MKRRRRSLCSRRPERLRRSSNRLNSEIAQVLKQNDVRGPLSGDRRRSRRQLARGARCAMMKADAARMSKVIKSAGIRAE